MGFLDRLLRRDTALPKPTPSVPEEQSNADKRREFILLSLRDRYPGQEGFRLPVPAGVVEDVLAYAVPEPVGGAAPHWHYVTRGLSDAPASQGVELTMRVAASTDGTGTPPLWPVDLLTYLATYVADHGHPILPNHHLDMQGPIAGEEEPGGGAEPLTAAVFSPDPALTSSNRSAGTVVFNQLIGITARDLRDALGWRTEKFIDLLTGAYPLGVTVVGRPSLRADARLAARIDEGTAKEGSSTSHGVADRLEQKYVDGRLRLAMGPVAVEAVLSAQRTRLGFEREFTLVGPGPAVRFLPAQDTPRASVDPAGDGLIEVTRTVSDEIRARLDASPGTYELTTVNVTIEVIEADPHPKMM